MLRIVVPEVELWDENNQIFIKAKSQVLQLEHSLVSISKWESKWHKCFIGSDDKTTSEILDYIKCMTITQSVDNSVYYRLSDSNITEIDNYINNPMTATYFSTESKHGISREQVTSELIYYWMIAYNIPFECEKWHLNRLLTLIRICNIKNTPPKKLSQSELLSRNARLNAERRKKFNTTG